MRDACSGDKTIRVGEEMGVYRVLLRKPEGRDLGLGGWISRRWDVGIWIGLVWPRIGTGGGRL